MWRLTLLWSFFMQLAFALPCPAKVPLLPYFPFQSSFVGNLSLRTLHFLMVHFFVLNFNISSTSTETLTKSTKLEDHQDKGSARRLFFAPQFAQDLALNFRQLFTKNVAIFNFKMNYQHWRMHWQSFTPGILMQNRGLIEEGYTIAENILTHLQAKLQLSKIQLRHGFKYIMPIKFYLYNKPNHSLDSRENLHTLYKLNVRP